MTRINLNEFIKVKLTDKGKEIYYNQFKNINNNYGSEIIKPHYPEEDDDGYTKFQLWDFMETYSKDLYGVIYPFEIVFDEENRLID